MPAGKIDYEPREDEPGGLECVGGCARTPHVLAWLLALALVGALGASCTIEDVEDEVVIAESVPAPSGVSPTVQVTRELGLGGDSDRVDEGRFTYVRLRVLTDGADLFPFASIQVWLRTSEDARIDLAEATNFERGETERELDVLFTGNITPFLADEDLTMNWDIIYKSEADFPGASMELELTVGVSVDVRIL